MALCNLVQENESFSSLYKALCIGIATASYILYGYIMPYALCIGVELFLSFSTVLVQLIKQHLSLVLAILMQ